MNTAQTSEPVAGRTHALEVGQFNPTRVTYDDVFDVAFAIYESADLPIRFMRQLTQLPGKLGRYDLMGMNATLIQLFDAP
jgi:hypothetical protein